jgi:hypothetical protein
VKTFCTLRTNGFARRLNLEPESRRGWKPLDKLTTFSKMSAPAVAVIAIIIVGGPMKAFAQTNEIQVYDAEIEELGKFNVMVHSNFTPIGRNVPVFPGGIVPNDSVNGAG